MKTRRKINSEVTQRDTRLMTSSNVGDMPIDLLIEIFSRLPSKSVAKFRCVSKPWGSILRLPSFTELYLTRSSARPRLLFACNNKITKEVLFFSSTQPHIVDENLSCLTASYHMKIPCDVFGWERLISPIRGLIFFRDMRILKGRDHRVSVICNPSTRQSWTLPKVKTRRRIKVRSYFGYDPVEKQHKVLSMTSKLNTNGIFEEHQVLTLGTGGLSWRRIECSVPHYPSLRYNQVCINGIIYYTAFNLGNSASAHLIIVCFDVKSEKFSFVEYLETTIIEFGVTALINCNGKLGSLSHNLSDFIDGRSRSFTLWVLEDIEKQEWSKKICALSSLWQNTVGNARLRFVGMTQTNEIVLSASYPSAPFYIFFYNIERGTITRVEMQGMEASNALEIYPYLGHVEDVKLLQMF